MWNPTDAEYHAYRALGSTDVKALSKSISDYIRTRDFKSTRATEFGSLCHTLLLEPEKFNERYVMLDIPRITKAIKEEHAGKTIVKPKDLEEAKSMIGIFPEVPGIKAADKEVPLKAMCRGLAIKAKFDAVNFKKHIIFDFKTINANSLSSLVRGYGLRDLGWDIQAYHYKLVYHYHTGVPFDKIDFAFLVTEKGSYEHLVIQLDGKCDDIAEQKHLRALENYEEFLCFYNKTQETMDLSEANRTDFPKYGLQKFILTPDGLDEKSKELYNNANGEIKYG